MQARMSPARIESILTSVKRVREGRSLTVKQFQKLVFVPRPGAGSSCCRVTLATDASLTGWGAVMSDHPACGLPDLEPFRRVSSGLLSLREF